MNLEALAPDEVVALCFDEVAVADEMAAWCAGKVERTIARDGDVVTTLWVPTAKGPRPAVLGDWIVRRDEDDYTVMVGAAFEASHAPA